MAIRRAQRGGRDVSTGLLLLALLGTASAAALCCAVLWLWFRPEAVAGRLYRAGLDAQVAGDLVRAQRNFSLALQRRPGLAEAALALGFTHLGFRGPQLRQTSIEELCDRAQAGDTTALDAADRAFAQCISAALQRPPDRPVQALFAATTAEMIATAWKGRAVTALVRAAAAYELGQSGQCREWVDVVMGALTEADRFAASEDSAALRQLAEAMRQGR